MVDYKDAGVDIEEGYKAVSKYKDFAKATMIPGVLNGLGVLLVCLLFPRG